MCLINETGCVAHGVRRKSPPEIIPPCVIQMWRKSPPPPTHTQACVRVHAHTHMCVCMRARVCVRVCVCLHFYILLFLFYIILYYIYAMATPIYTIKAAILYRVADKSEKTEKKQGFSKSHTHTRGHVHAHACVPVCVYVRVYGWERGDFLRISITEGGFSPEGLSSGGIFSYTRCTRPYLPSTANRTMAQMLSSLTRILLLSFCPKHLASLLAL